MQVSNFQAAVNELICSYSNNLSNKVDEEQAFAQQVGDAKLSVTISPQIGRRLLGAGVYKDIAKRWCLKNERFNYLDRAWVKFEIANGTLTQFNCLLDILKSSKVFTCVIGKNLTDTPKEIIYSEDTILRAPFRLSLTNELIKLNRQYRTAPDIDTAVNQLVINYFQLLGDRTDSQVVKYKLSSGSTIFSVTICKEVKNAFLSAGFNENSAKRILCNEKFWVRFKIKYCSFREFDLFVENLQASNISAFILGRFVSKSRNEPVPQVVKALASDIGFLNVKYVVAPSTLMINGKNLITPKFIQKVNNLYA